MTTSSTPSLITAFIMLAVTATAQTTERVSVDSAGAQANNGSYEIALSADGRYSAFYGRATNLVPGDTNGLEDVFVHDRVTGQVTRVSLDSNGVQGNGMSIGPNISADGRFVVFKSLASNLVPGDTNANWDFFVHDRQTGQTSRISVSSAGVQGNAASGENTYDRASLSANGRYVAFYSTANNLVAGDTNGVQDIFVHDRLTSQTGIVSRSASGIQSNGMSRGTDISGDGRFVMFTSSASNLVPGDTNSRTDVFRCDLSTGLITRDSVDSAGQQATGTSAFPTISADGRFTAFASDAANLVPNDTNAVLDIFVRDSQTGQISRVSVDSAGGQANGASGTDGQYAFTSALSFDGRYVAFCSLADNLVPGDTNGSWDVFFHDRQLGTTTRVSVDSAGGQANWHSIPPAMSADGRYVGFASESSNLVPGDTNGYHDVFVRDCGGINLSMIGTCDGQVALTIERATPFGFVAFLYGPAGTYTQPGGPCAGLVLGISAPVVGAIAVADLVGAISYQFYAPPRLCGVTVQAVDLTTCAATQAVVLESRVFRLAKNRSCSPFQTRVIDLFLTEAEAGSPIALFYGPAGSFVKSGSPCAGTMLGISNPVLMAQLTADALGNATFAITTTPALCGLTVQAVERAGCVASNTITL